MSHPDEGTLHALLDGELDREDAAEVDRHIQECARCATRLEEARGFAGESLRLIAQVEPLSPGHSAAERVPPIGAPIPPSPFESASFGVPRQVGEPIILIPDNPTYQQHARGWRPLAWAATLFVAVGLGYAWNASVRPSAPTSDPTSPAVATPRATVSEVELARRPFRDSVTPAGTSVESGRADTAALLAGTEGTARSERSVTGPPAASRRPAEPPVREAPAVEPPATELAAASRASEPEARRAAAEKERAIQQAGNGAADEQRVAQPVLEPERSEPDADAKANASEDSAADAAALATGGAGAESFAAADTAAAALAEPAAPASSTERQANVYQRVGLDEVVRQLGERLHVVEGLRPELVGLVRGDQVPGADPTRPVVRAVYVDALNRLIFLDQQRVGRNAPTGGRVGTTPSVSAANGQSRASWRRGNVWLSLNGRIDTETVRALADQVR